MSFQQIINYDNPADFSFDANKIEVINEAKLKLVDKSGIQIIEDCADDTGWAFDAAKAEFVAGKIQQKSQAPLNYQSVATYTANINLSYALGVLTGTAVGGAAVLANRLDLAHDDIRYVDYDGTDNADSQQTGAIKFKVTPNYTGSPALQQNFFHIGKSPGDSANNIALVQKTNGDIQLIISSSSGSTILSVVVGNWSPTLGVTYEFEVNYDITAGVTRFYIDGVQLGATIGGTGTRSSDIAQFRIGSNFVGSIASNFAVEDLVVFSTVQHTTNYTPGYTLSDTEFAETTSQPPSVPYTGLGAVQSIDTLVVVATSTVKFILRLVNVDDVWFDGANWVPSDLSFAEANTVTEINDNLASLAAIGGTTALAVLVAFGASITQTNVDNTDLEFTGQQFPLDDPAIINNSAVFADSLDLFAATLVEPGSDTVTFQIIVNEIPMYWTGIVWSVAILDDISQSNTLADVAANVATLDLTNGKNLKVNAILHSDDASSTPELAQVVLDYGFQGPVPVTPTECFLFAYLKDILADAKTGTLEIENLKAFSTAGTVVSANKQTVPFDENGYVELSVIETETVGKKYVFRINYTDFAGNAKVSVLGNLQVPNQASENIANLF